MKPTFLSNNKFNLQPLCESTLQKLLPSRLFSLLEHAICYAKNHVNQAQAYGRSAVLSHLANVRHLVGDIFLFMGLVGFFLHQFFPIEPDDRTWYYTNWFFFLRTLRYPLIILFWSMATLYYWPKANKSVYIIFTVIHSFGWLMIIHYSFFVYDYKTFWMIPAWDIMLMALSFGIGFVMCADHLVYLWEHKRKGNHARLVGIAEINIPLEQKDLHLKSLAAEYRLLNSKY